MFQPTVRVAAICGLLAWGASLLAEDQVIVKPEETDEILSNPGIGWETFHQTSKQDKSLPKWIPSTIQYARWGWAELEPQPGKLNTAFLDKVLKETHDSGQKLAFRVMCCSTAKGQPYHPKWCGKELQADYEGQGPYPIPDMDDPAVLKAHLDFIKRLGERYDGHPDIDHIDLGSIGWWGEWHLSGSTKCGLPTLENRKKVVNAYLAAFKKTPLLMLIGGGDCLKYACAHGTGWRADCLGDMGGFSRTWCHMRQGYPTYIRESGINDSWKTAPVAFETCWDMRKWVNDGWSLRYIFNYALACHASVINNKSAPLPQGAECSARDRAVPSQAGLSLRSQGTEASCPGESGGKLDILDEMAECRIGPLLPALSIGLSLRNGGSEPDCMTTINHWLPGSIEPFTSDFFKMPKDLPPGKMVPVTLTFSWWSSDIPPGEYSLSIGVVDLYARPAAVPTDKWKAIEALIQAGFEPAIRLGIKGRAADGWYPLSKIQVVK